MEAETSFNEVVVDCYNQMQLACSRWQLDEGGWGGKMRDHRGPRWARLADEKWVWFLVGLWYE